MTLIDPCTMDTMAFVASLVPYGALAEVGVYKGDSALILRKWNPGRDLYLYDTFSGIPERTEGLDKHSIGDFSDTTVEEVRKLLPDARIKVGIFPETFVPTFYAFVHVDCDQYRTIKACISFFSPWMTPGGKMWFDDYGCLPGADQAIKESGRPFRLTPGNKAMMEF